MRKRFLLVLMLLICARMPVEAFENEVVLPIVFSKEVSPDQNLQSKQGNFQPLCQVRGPLPDPACTPGDVLPVGLDKICVSGYSKTVRNVPESLKRTVYANYGVTTHPRGSYEVDHLIPLSLGGSNDIKNLWPQAAEPLPGFRQKDGFENRLRRLVCKGELSIEEAQIMIASDWEYFWERLMRPMDNAGVITNLEGQP